MYRSGDFADPPFEPFPVNSRCPLPEALAHLVAWLRKNYERVSRRPAGPRRVYLGTCGVGKTTAVCKAVALDVLPAGGFGMRLAMMTPERWKA